MMACRDGCGACCIAPSINSALPGMPHGKAAGERCVQLTADHRCAVFGHPSRPAFCAGLQASTEMCGDSREHALQFLNQLEADTRPMEAVNADSPCVGYCTTVLGDDVCRSCLRTFEEVTSWPTITDEERRKINRRIQLLKTNNGTAG